jgi:arylsulfatase A-like enzyme
VKAGGSTAQLAITMDWVATFFEAAGVRAHPDYPLDGLSLLPVLEQPERVIERELFWRMKFRTQKALRSGKWKYLSIEGDEFLYDLAADARERANLGKRDPARLAAMRARYAAWEATMPRIPEDASASIPYGKSDMAMPSS